MQLGMIGLGRMGANIVRRLMRDGHECVVYDVNEAAIAELESEGATGARSLAEFAAKLTAPRAAWIMVPAAIAGATVDELAAPLRARRHHDRRRQQLLPRRHRPRRRRCKARGIHYVDVGTSGGVFGLERGFCMMIGGEDRIVAPPRPDLPHARAGRRDGAAHAGAPRPCRRRPSTATCTAAATAPGTS